MVEKNFPFRKENSDLDIGLPDGCSDEMYLRALEDGLKQIESLFNPDLMIYLAGADPHIGDRLGRLHLTFDGLAKRDFMVMQWAKRLSLPVAIAMAGGYGKNILDTVAIHTKTIEISIGNLWK
jgi:acetoin utilization deacetylase AcuC-like enzyme